MPLILIRHAAVEADPEQPAALWPLSDRGRRSARRLARAPLWWDVVRIFTSPEVKAHETAQILAGSNGITVTVVAELAEVRRPVGQWFGDAYPGGYPGAVRDYVARPDEPVHGWEPAAAAARRMRTCVERLIRLESGLFAVCGHGLSLALYLASVTGGQPADIWPTITLPDVAVVAPESRSVLYPFGRWATPGEDAVSALAPTAWGGDDRG